MGFLGPPRVQGEGQFSGSWDWGFFRRCGKIGEKSLGLFEQVWEKIKRKLHSDGSSTDFFIEKVRNYRFCVLCCCTNLKVCFVELMFRLFLYVKVLGDKIKEEL